MLTVNLYNIYLGDFDAATQPNLDYFGQNLGGTPWYNIQTTYVDATGVPLENNVTWIQSVAVSAAGLNYSFSTDYHSACVAFLSDLFTKGTLPADSKGVYTIFFRDVVLAGAMVQWCGLHSYFLYGGKYMKYSLVVDPTSVWTVCMLGGEACDVKCFL